jgi:hypothetical protein
MATHDYDIANQSGANFRTDLNNALDAIVSNNSNASDPSTTFAYMWWVDTSNNVLKLRNSANNAWITLPMSITASNTITPTLNMGTGAEEDVKIVFDGNAKDFYIALDDSADKLIIGEGSTVGTNSILTITDDSVTIGDGTEVDTKIVFDGNAQDFYIGLDDSADDLIIGKGSTVGTTPAIVIDENQKVGIGDTPDLAALHVKTADSGASADSGADELVLENSGDTGMTILSGTTSSGSIRFGDSDDNDNGLIIYNHGSTPFMRFFTGGSEKVRLTGGNVGIGTTTPETKLEISDSVDNGLFQALQITNTDHANGETGQKVAINFKLSRGGTMRDAARITAGKDGDWNDASGADSHLAFDTTNNDIRAEKMRIRSGGGLLINSTSSVSTQSQLELHGNPVYQYFRNTGATAGLHFRIEVDTNNTFYLLNQSSAGVYLPSGNTSWSGLSDETLKENITDIGSVLDKVKNYRTAKYNWKNDSDKKSRIGFIAQDWEKDFPQVIEKNKDEKLGINYTETIPVLLKAIQEQQEQIESLQKEIEVLKNGN